jgi:hypothetical protein
MTAETFEFICYYCHQNATAGQFHQGKWHPCPNCGEVIFLMPPRSHGEEVGNRQRPISTHNVPTSASERDELDAISNAVIDLLFRPTRWNFNRPAMIALTSLSILLLLCITFLCVPPVRDYLSGRFLTHPFWRSNRKLLIAWVEFIRISSELMLALTVGSALYAKALAEWLRNSADLAQSKRKAALAERRTELESSTKDMAREFLALFQKSQKWNGIVETTRTAIRLHSLGYTLSRRLVSGLPNLYRHLIVFGLYSSFPGGLYGLLGFVLVFIIQVCKVSKLYLDSPVFN